MTAALAGSGAEKLNFQSEEDGKSQYPASWILTGRQTMGMFSGRDMQVNTTPREGQSFPLGALGNAACQRQDEQSVQHMEA